MTRNGVMVLWRALLPTMRSRNMRRVQTITLGIVEKWYEEELINVLKEIGITASEKNLERLKI